MKIQNSHPARALPYILGDALKSLLFVSLCLLGLSGTAMAVVNPDGVDWDASSNLTFVTSAYTAIYGKAPDAGTLKMQASRLKNQGDRYKFAKWLMVQPEYKRDFGSPRGPYLVFHNARRTKYTVAKQLPRGYTEWVERDKAFGPAFLLKSYYDRSGGPATGTEDPMAASGPLTPESIVGTYEFSSRSGYKGNTNGYQVKGTIKFTQEIGYKTSKVAYVTKKGASRSEQWKYTLRDGKLSFIQGGYIYAARIEGDTKTFELKGYQTEVASRSRFPLDYKFVRK